MEGLSEGLAFGTGCKHFLLGPQPLTSFLFGKEGQERWEGGKIGEKLANSTSEGGNRRWKEEGGDMTQWIID